MDPIAYVGILGISIILLVAGMHKYVGVDDNSSIQKRLSSSELPIKEFPRNLKTDLKTNIISRFCNAPNDIKQESEGKVEGNVTLAGVIIVTRHGDRGPFLHVRNMSAVNCAGDFSKDPELHAVYQNYQTFLQNVTTYSRSAWAQFLGPFHGAPMLPYNSRDCKLSQLTTVGVGQLLKVGLVLRNAYFHKLNLANASFSSKDVIVFSTRYTRTVQSAVALLYAFIGNESVQNLAKISHKESPSYAFCFSDCACSAVDNYSKLNSEEIKNHLKSHPAVSDITKQASSIVLRMKEQTTNPNTFVDSLLTYVCHNAPLPCMNSKSEKICVKTDHVTRIFDYTEWEARQQSKSQARRRHGLLRAYGLLRNIVNHMLSMISEGKPKIVLYSGHDRTLEYLSIALGIFADQAILPHYASRFIIEIYKINPKNENHVASDFYFRVVVNGKDFTQEIPFCNLSPKKESKLCPIEAIIRLLHEDYFVPFNATNFKDACSSHKHN